MLGKIFHLVPDIKYKIDENHAEWENLGVIWGNQLHQICKLKKWLFLQMIIFWVHPKPTSTEHPISSK